MTFRTKLLLFVFIASCFALATAAEEQTATTREISNNVHMINEAVSGNARGVQEISSASGQLSNLAEELKGIVTHYSI